MITLDQVSQPSSLRSLQLAEPLVEVPVPEWDRAGTRQERTGTEWRQGCSAGEGGREGGAIGGWLAVKPSGGGHWKWHSPCPVASPGGLHRQPKASPPAQSSDLVPQRRSVSAA